MFSLLVLIPRTTYDHADFVLKEYTLRFCFVTYDIFYVEVGGLYLQALAQKFASIAQKKRKKWIPRISFIATSPPTESHSVGAPNETFSLSKISLHPC